MEETADQACPGAAISRIRLRALAEQRRRPPSGRGPVLATLHAAKGLEFDHVLVTDGGWRRPHRDLEEARIYAWIERRAKDSEPEHRSGLQVETWQVPMVEVVLRPL